MLWAWSVVCLSTCQDDLGQGNKFLHMATMPLYLDLV